jgi:NADH:ubiquinone oxidoreductase subunit 6 (subunit J)
LFGSIIAIAGAIGPFYIAVMTAFVGETQSYEYDRWAGSVVWLIGGILLIIFSIPLGRLLGRGLN